MKVQNPRNQIKDTVEIFTNKLIQAKKKKKRYRTRLTKHYIQT